MLNQKTKKKALVSIISHKFYLNKTDLLQTRITNWHHDFNSLFHNDKNTVYIHRFTNHLAKDIENFGNIDVFNCEG